VTAATVFGKPLPEGGTIGVAAPASPYENRSEILRGVERWESLGYRVKLASGVYERDDYVAGDELERAADLTALFADPSVDVVQCLKGGFGCAQTIPHVDFDVVAANPKPFVGYSDITALHVALRQRAGLATIYGYGLTGMGDPETTDYTRDRLLAVLREGGAGPVPPHPEDPYTRTLNGGTVTAPLVGGCLWLLNQTMGTPWEVDLAGSIFFFEDYDAPAWYIEGNLTQLAHAGKLADVRGIVVGELEKCDWSENRPEWPRTRSIEDVLERCLEPLDVPTLYGMPLGHGKHQAAIPLGVTATLDADARTLTFDEPALRAGSQ
jgi:muramoyltetrapeptide carboxypeptidase